MSHPLRRGVLDHPVTGRGIGWRRYAVGARVYDAVSLEWPIYGAARGQGMQLLAPAPGEHILDVGCGTGLNLPLLAPAIGTHGLVTGVDASRQMLDRGRARAARRGWTDRVRWRQADAGLPGTGASWVERPADAVVFTYALSVIPGWRQAFDNALTAARPGARILIVDLALPPAGPAPPRPWPGSPAGPAEQTRTGTPGSVSPKTRTPSRTGSAAAVTSRWSLATSRPHDTPSCAGTPRSTRSTSAPSAARGGDPSTPGRPRPSQPEEPPRGAEG